MRTPKGNAGIFAAAELPEKVSARALMASSTETKEIVDTGSTYHIFTSASFFVRMQACDVRLELIAGYGAHHLAKGTAHVKIGYAELLVENVLLTSESVSLLPVPVILRKGHLAYFGENFHME